MSHVYRRAESVNFQYRRLIPERLRSALAGKTWIIESLGTSDPGLAKKRAAEVEVRVNAAFERAEIALLQQTGQQWFEEEFPRWRREKTRWWECNLLNADRFDPRVEIPTGDLIDPLGSVDQFRQSLLGFLKAHPDINIDPGSIEFERLTEAARLAYTEHYALPETAIILDRPIQSQPVVQPSGFESLTMEGLIHTWSAETAPAEKTIYSWKRIMAKLTTHMGVDDVTRISKAKMLEWKQSLLASGLSRKTVSNHLTIASTLFGWAERNMKLAMNPARGVTLKVKKKSRIRGFTDDEAKRILEAARKESEAHKRWVPWLACFTGARLEEICGAAAGDVRIIHDIPCLHIRLDNRDKRGGLKKDVDSERVVPLHGAVIAEGFMDYVKKLPRGGALFPLIKPDRFGRRGGNGSKTIGRWVREQVGIDDERVAPNHSWRHRFKTLCRSVAMREDAEEYLTSHSEGTSSGRRYGEHNVKALAAVIAMIPSPL